MSTHPRPISAGPFTPSLRLHKASGQAFIRPERLGPPIYLGKHGLTETHANYVRAPAELAVATPLAIASADQMTVAELIAHFWAHAQLYYHYPDGRCTPELASLRQALQPVLDLFAHHRCLLFGPKALKMVRDEMIRKRWSRRQINKQVGRIRLVFRWGTEEEFVPPGVHQALAAVRGLQQGRSDAPETPPVKPAKAGLIEAVCPFISQTIWDMIRVQLLCGCRPQDIVQMRPMDIDRSGDVWVATMVQHKTAWRGRTHHVYLGPQAQAILSAYLMRRPETECIFSPIESAADRRDLRTASRVTPLTAGNRRGMNRKTALARPFSCGA